MKITSLYGLLLIAIFTFSCQKNTEETQSGIEINFIKRGTEPLNKDSSVLLLNIQYVDENKNEIFSSESDGRQLALLFNKATWGISDPYAGPFYEVLASCNVQDSVQFQLTAEQLYINTFSLTEIPPELNLSDSSKIDFYVGIDDQMSESEFRNFVDERDQKAREKDRREFEERKAKEDSVIRQYLSDQEITDMTRTANGLWYVITREGVGQMPVENDLITIHYQGYLLDGTLFGSSYEQREPITFAFGVRDVLGGWDEGFGLLKLGAKATFILPSHLAKGSSSDEFIEPYSILRYEVELLKIEKRD